MIEARAPSLGRSGDTHPARTDGRQLWAETELAGMTANSRSAAALPAELREALLGVEEATGGTISRTARDQARHRAAALYRACGADPSALALARLCYAGELVSLSAVDLAADAAEAHRLIADLEALAGIPRVALGREVLHSARLLELPADVAVEVQLSLLLAFSGARWAAVCAWSETGPEILAGSGDGSWEDPGQEQTVHALLSESARDPISNAGITGLRLERLHPPPVALVADSSELARDQSELLLAEAGPVLSVLLDRKTAPGRESPTSEALLSSVERRLARLRFDLHDGPQQDVHLLAQDLTLFRAQLRPVLAGNPNSGRLLGRLDDLEAQLVALDGDLRRLSTAVQSPLLGPGSLPDALRSITEAFAARTAIEPQVELSGNLTQLSDSQQIALLSLVRESLSNIRKHSGAGRVWIAVSADSRGVHADIRDDGAGFDPEETLLVAARAGRLGLVGMHERVRMLGGRTHIDSRPGGPTVISAFLPPWPVEDSD